MKHKAIIVGAGRIGAAYNWPDDSYSHAGAYMALKDRVELVGFVDWDGERREAAHKKWGVPVDASFDACVDRHGIPTVVSVCSQPQYQCQLLHECSDERIKGVWAEKPYMGPETPWIAATQVNYLRRADPVHREIAEKAKGGHLTVEGKHDLTTWCHFRDLAKWWGAQSVQWEVSDGPCSYTYYSKGETHSFPNGGVDGGECMKLMLENLIDHIDEGVPLYSPPYEL